MVHEKHEKEPVYPEMPPWTMFFDGPLYDKYDEFMKNKDFSKILLSTKLKLANSHPGVTDTIRSTDSDWWTGKSPNDSYPDRLVPPNMYNSFSEDEASKDDEARRTRRTRAFILICILVMAALALGTAFVIHYLVIPPSDNAAKSHVNISFSENATKSDSTQQYTTTTLPSNPASRGDGIQHMEANETQDGARKPQGKIFDGSPDDGKKIKEKNEKIKLQVSSTTSKAHYTTTSMATTTSLDPLDFFGMDMMSTTETSSSIKTWTLSSPTSTSSSVSLDNIPVNLTTPIPEDIQDPSVVNENDTSSTNVSHTEQRNDTSLQGLHQTEQENNTSLTDLPQADQRNGTSLVNSSQAAKGNKTSLLDLSEADQGNNTSLLDLSEADQGHNTSLLDLSEADQGNNTSLLDLSEADQGHNTSLLDLSEAGQGNNTSLLDLSEAGQGNNTSLLDLSEAGQGNNTALLDLSEAGQGNNTSLLDLSEADQGNNTSDLPHIDRENNSVSMANVSHFDTENTTALKHTSGIDQENTPLVVDSGNITEENKPMPTGSPFTQLENKTSLMSSKFKNDSILEQENNTSIGRNDIIITTDSLSPKVKASTLSADNESLAIFITTNEPVNVLPSVLTTGNITLEPRSETLLTTERAPALNDTDDNEASNGTESEHVPVFNATTEPPQSSVSTTSPLHPLTTTVTGFSTEVPIPSEIRLQSKVNEHIMTFNGTGIESAENAAMDKTDIAAMDTTDIAAMDKTDIAAMDKSVLQPMVSTTTGVGASNELLAYETTTQAVTKTLNPAVFNLVHMYDVTAYRSENTKIACHVKRAVNWLYVSIRAKSNWKPVEVRLYPTGDVMWSSKATRHDVTYSIIESNNGPGDNIALGLLIRELECQDAMDFTCQLRTESVDVKNTSHLTIVGKPDRKIQLTLGPSIIEDRAFRITAKWQAGYPVPWAELFWSAVDAQGKRYNLADYGDYQDVKLHKDDKSCQTFLTHSIVIFPKMYLNDTTVAVGADVTKARFFVDEIKKPILDEVQPGVQKILVIPLNYCDKEYKDVSVTHPFEKCMKFIRCLPDDLSVQLCPRGTCFFEGAQKCG